VYIVRLCSTLVMHNKYTHAPPSSLSLCLPLSVLASTLCVPVPLRTHVHAAVCLCLLTTWPGWRWGRTDAAMGVVLGGCAAAGAAGGVPAGMACSAGRRARAAHPPPRSPVCRGILVAAAQGAALCCLRHPTLQHGRRPRPRPRVRVPLQPLPTCTHGHTQAHRHMHIRKHTY
jgi:hypothetical protein